MVAQIIAIPTNSMNDVFFVLLFLLTYQGWQPKNPPKKTHPKKTKKTHLKKRQKVGFFWFFWVFLIFFSF